MNDARSDIRVEPTVPDGDGGLVRIRLDVAYDGTGFHGWARQPELRTVQGVLEDALRLVLRLGGRDGPAGPASAPRLAVAGRTDAGVHARGQVAHLDVPTGALLGIRPTADEATGWLRHRLARALPADVRVIGLTTAPYWFHARFSALARRYQFRIADDPAGANPLRRHDTLWHRAALTVEAMHQAAQGLVGEHDFLPFARPRAGSSTVRRLRRLDVWRDDERVVVCDVEGDAFCHHQVRFMVGALLAVGSGQRTLCWPGQVLAHGVRDPAVQLAGAHGLTLVGVEYPMWPSTRERGAGPPLSPAAERRR